MSDFSLLPQAIFHAAARAALALVVLAAAAWLADRLLRRIGPQAQHRAWVAALGLGVCLPLAPVFSWQLPLLSVLHGQTAPQTGEHSWARLLPATAHWTMAAAWQQRLGLLAMAIMAGALLRLAVGWCRVQAMAARAIAGPLPREAADLLLHAAEKAGVDAPAVRFSTELQSPVVMGWLRPILLAPKDLFAASREDIAAALAHECAHIARRDYAKNLLCELLLCAVAWHPAAWWMRRRIAVSREEICDQMAARSLGSRSGYAAALLRIAQNVTDPLPAGYAIGIFDGNPLEERIMRITSQEVPPGRGTKGLLTLCAAAVLLGGIWTASAVPAPQAKVYQVGGDISAPVLIHSVDAEYSAKARRAKYQGIDIVKLVVDTHGMPRDVHVIRKLGMGLDEKAIEAVKQYRFKPAMRAGQPVPVALTIEVHFSIY